MKKHEQAESENFKNVTNKNNNLHEMPNISHPRWKMFTTGHNS